MTALVMASAPGKIVLSGEYAVLDGAPACVMAVDRFACAGICSIEGQTSTVTAPSFTDSVGRFRGQSGDVEWLAGQDQFAIVEHVWQLSGRSDAVEIELDTSGFYDRSGNKLGLGSSAALTVALCMALSNEATGNERAKLAHNAHRALQGGVGSGVDIASSLAGGLLEYRMEGCSSQALNWPDALLFDVIYTGVAASTADRLERLKAQTSQPSRQRLLEAAHEIAAAWRSGAAARVLREYSAYTEALFEFGVDHDLGIFDAGHEDLWRRAAAAGLTYKPCGAGGGDVGILLGSDAGAMQAFVANLPDNAQRVDCRLCTKGATADIVVNKA